MGQHWHAHEWLLEWRYFHDWRVMDWQNTEQHHHLEKKQTITQNRENGRLKRFAWRQVIVSVRVNVGFTFVEPQTSSQMGWLFEFAANHGGVRLNQVNELVGRFGNVRQLSVAFTRSCPNHLARNSEMGKKTWQTEEEVEKQHQGMDRPGVSKS